MLIADVSHHKPIKDWSLVKKNCSFLVCKATQGTDHIDSTLKDFISGCEKNKIPYWLYCYLNADGTEVEQAKFMVKTCESLVGSFFIGYCIDAEKNSLKHKNPKCRGKLPKAENVKKAVDYIKSLDYKAMFYGTAYLDVIKAVRDENCAIWYARYGKNNGKYDPKYGVKETYQKYVDLHQYTSLGNCPGIAAGCDLSRVTNLTKPLSWFTEKKKKEVNKKPMVTTNTKTCTASQAIAVAKAEDGYLEKKSNSNLTSKTGNAGKNNYTKYEKDLFGTNGNYWCATFVSWVIWMTCGKDKTKAQKVMYALSKSCETIRGKFVAAKRYGATPKNGALIFFKGSRHAGANHIGIVTKYDATYVYTCEGNTSSDAGVVDNGGAVNQKKYKIKDSKILGYGYPNYDSETTSKPTTSSTTSKPSVSTKKGYTGEFPKLPVRGYFKNKDVSSEVCKLKKFLNWYGNYGLDTTNKNYFDKTVECVKKFQKSVGITVDGEFGKTSLAKAKAVKK